MTRLGALIESGAAAEMMKAAGLDINEPIEVAPESTGERRDPGTTTIRRPKKGEPKTDSAENTEEAAEGVEAAPADADTAEVDAEELPVEEASADTVKASGEE